MVHRASLSLIKIQVVDYLQIPGAHLHEVFYVKSSMRDR